MRKKMTLGLNGYVLSPFGEVDMNSPEYGWGGAGATSSSSSEPKPFDINNLVTTIGQVGSGILSIFAPKQPTATATQPSADSLLQQQQAQLAMQQQLAAQRAAEQKANLPLYIAGGVGGLLILALLLKK